jgi:hypothetical protein
MEETKVRKTPVGWLVGGALLGLLQVVAVAVKKPLGISTQFVVADTQVLEATNPAYVAEHPLISASKYTDPGYGWWLAVGVIVGAALAALATKRWRVTTAPVWWRANHGAAAWKRLAAAFAGGFLILLGARFAHGCTSGQFASGWAQLSIAALPFTVALFGAAMLTARFVYPRTPEIEE